MKLALVGRPNVGKSALFNRICKKKISIVEDISGVTRDRIYATAEHLGHRFEVIDTGGITFDEEIDFHDEVKVQAHIAIEEADVIVMVVDVQSTPSHVDEEIAKILLKTKKPVILAVNKVDGREIEPQIYSYQKLGITEIIGISALHGYQVMELMERAFAQVKNPSEIEEDPKPKIAVIGKPNAGKSTFLNYLMREKRLIESPVAGTTRDAVDVSISVNNTSYLFIDTAGIKRKNKQEDVIEKFATLRTEKAIERSDICLFILDVRKALSHEEKKWLKLIQKLGKGLILLFNKWDLISDTRMEHYTQAIDRENPGLKPYPKLYVSAKTGRNVEKIFDWIHQILEKSSQKITTGQLNKWVQLAMQYRPPAMILGKRLRIYYATQLKAPPLRFIFFINRPDLMQNTYRKYLMRQFRKHFNVEGVPVYFELRSKTFLSKHSYR